MRRAFLLLLQNLPEVCVRLTNNSRNSLWRAMRTVSRGLNRPEPGRAQLLLALMLPWWSVRWGGWGAGPAEVKSSEVLVKLDDLRWIQSCEATREGSWGLASAFTHGWGGCLHLWLIFLLFKLSSFCYFRNTTTATEPPTMTRDTSRMTTTTVIKDKSKCSAQNPAGWCEHGVALHWV